MATQDVTIWNEGQTNATIVDSSGDVQTKVNQIIPGTAATHLGKEEDTAHTNGDVGVMALAVRVDGMITLASHNGDYTPLACDGLGNLKVVSAGEVDSVKLRLGRSFVISTYNNNFGTGATMSIHIQTPNTLDRTFMRWLYDITLSGHFEVYEGGSVTNGTTATILNRDRNSANTSVMTGHLLNATRSGGTLIIYKPWGAASQKANVAGDTENWILKQNTWYHFIITSDKPSNLGWIDLNWYEEVV